MITITLIALALQAGGSAPLPPGRMPVGRPSAGNVAESPLQQVAPPVRSSALVDTSTQAHVPPDARSSFPVLVSPRDAPVSSLSVLTVEYDSNSVPTIYTKIHFATAIIFPDSEKIMEVIAGDKDWWQLYGPDHVVFVKPSKAGTATNLTVTGASGNIYSFLLQEISRDDTPERTPIDKSAPPNLPLSPHAKVILHMPETFAQRLDRSGPKYMSKVEADQAIQAADQRADAAAEEARDIKATAAKVVDQEVTRLRTNYPAALEFNYRIQLDTKPFLVRAMFADDKFTYIKLDSEEAPAVYELKDGKPNLVNFDFVNGVFVIRKVVDQGYLAIGKAKLPFTRAQR